MKPPGLRPINCAPDVDAILVGIGTVLRDNPTLTARLSDAPLRLALRQPLRIVVDSRLRIPLKAAVLQHQQTAHTVIATTTAASARKINLLQAARHRCAGPAQASAIMSACPCYGRGWDN